MLARRAPAKINLFLDVIRRRDDGFHELHTVFLAVDLCDVLHAEEAPECHLAVEGPFASLAPAGDGNLVQRALRALEEEVGGTLPPMGFRLEKNIPVFAGLGGGSSDAATALLLVDEILNLKLGSERMERVAARIGSDTAFFIRGGAAEGRGRGEILDPLPVRDVPILLIIPPLVVPTREAYGALSADMMGARSDADGVRRWLRGEENLPECLHNTFETALDRKHPVFAEVRDFLVTCGAVLARLSGSGSACFGIFEDEATRNAAARAVPQNWRAFPCRTHAHDEADR